MNELLLSSPKQCTVKWVLENCLLVSSPWCVFVARNLSTLLTCYPKRKKRKTDMTVVQLNLLTTATLGTEEMGFSFLSKVDETMTKVSIVEEDGKLSRALSRFLDLL